MKKYREPAHSTPRAQGAVAAKKKRKEKEETYNDSRIYLMKRCRKSAYFAPRAQGAVAGTRCFDSETHLSWCTAWIVGLVTHAFIKLLDRLIVG